MAYSLVVAGGSTPGVRHPPEKRDGRRPDIQGMRAVAVLMVCAFHAGIPGISGGFVGVDVFFVLSGFLITGLLVREATTTGRLDLPAFWARRARRLLPAATLVVVTVAVLTVVALPVTRWRSVAIDMAAGSVYGMNWLLAHRSVDYLAAGAAPGPLQHYWSLAVEEQFYLVWPVLVLAALATRRVLRLPLRVVLALCLALVAVPSFMWSVHLARVDPGPAYFVTTTRVWELALGGALALVPQRWPSRIPPPVAAGAGWVGVALLVAGLVLIDSRTPFPGSAALLPTAGAALVVLAGTAAPTVGPVRLLGLPPLQWIGDRSYSWYLWHWPLVVAATAWVAPGGGSLPPLVGAGVVVASLVPAALAYRVVEHPLHRSARLAGTVRGLVLGGACTAAGLAAAVILWQAVPTATAGATPVPGAAPGPSTGPLGAAAITDVTRAHTVQQAEGFVPDMLSATADVPRIDGDGCQMNRDEVTLRTCTFGSDTPSLRVAVVGDSKMSQWYPAIEAIAERRDWQVTTYVMSSCALTHEPVRFVGIGVYENCATVNEQRFEALEDPAVDLVITSQRPGQSSREGLDPQQRRQAMIDDLRGIWQRLAARGTPVIVVLDNPSSGDGVLDCVAADPGRLDACEFSLADGIARSGAPTQLAAAQGLDGVGVVDLSPWICPGDRCSPVIGGVLVYRSGSHLTATYVRTLTDRFDEQIGALPFIGPARN